jgi:hypothetical protein
MYHCLRKSGHEGKVPSLRLGIFLRGPQHIGVPSALPDYQLGTVDEILRKTFAVSSRHVLREAQLGNK